MTVSRRGLRCWGDLVGLAGAPAPVVARLQGPAAAVPADRDGVARWPRQVTEPVADCPAGFARRLAAQRARPASPMRAADVKVA